MTIKEGHALCTQSIGKLQHHILHRQLPALLLYCELLSIQHHGQLSTHMHCFISPTLVCLSHKARLVG